MAFSTQKDFLKIGFLNDCNDLTTESRKRYQVSLKTYTSCTDSRAWSLSQEKQAKYLTDIVACGAKFVEDCDGFESGDSENNQSGGRNSSPGPSRGINRPSTSRPGTIRPDTSRPGTSRPDTGRPVTGAGGSGGGSVPGDRRPGSSSGQGTVTGQGAETGKGSEFDADGGSGNFTSGDQGHGSEIRADDSLIEAACMKLDEINAIVRENSELKRKLELSEDKLDQLDKENNKIKAIITDSTAGSFGPVEDEIKVLKAKGELNTDNVLKVLKKYIEDSKVQNRKCNMMLVENESLKSRIEKLEARVKISVLPAKKETSADVNYLQSTVNDLRNKMLQLRAIEEDRAKLKVEFDNLKQQIKHIGSPDDLYNMKKATIAICEVKCDRDRLRDLINSMVGIEDDLKKIKERAEKTDKLEKQVAELNIRLENASSNQMAGGMRCDEMKLEIEKLRKEKAEAEVKLEHMTSEDSDFSQAQEKLKEFDRVLCELHFYKINYSELCNELRRVSYNCVQLETELEETKQKLCCSEYSISSYEKQMDDLMEIIRELESERKKCLQPFEQDGGTSQDAHIQDLLAITKVTTIYIQKETEARTKLEEELNKCKAELGLLSKVNIGRSREKFEDLQAKLKTCETEIGRLKKENEALLGQISNEDIEDLLDKLDACKRENEKLQNQVSNAGDKQQFDSVFGELNSCKAEINNLNDTIANLKKELDECLKNNGAAVLLQQKEDALKACQDKVEDLENQLGKITKELEESASICTEQLKQLKEHFENEKTDLQKKLDDEQHFQNTSSADLTTDLSNCRDELLKLSDQIKQEADKYQAEKEQLQQRVNQLNEAQQNLGQAGNTISEDIKDLEKKLSDCQRENEALQKERESLTIQLNEFNAGNDNELSRLRNELDKQIIASKACEDEKNSLTNQLLSANNDLSQLKSQLVEQKGQGDEDCERVKVALKDYQDKYNQLESRYDSLQQHDASIQKALDELRKEYEVKTLEWTKELNEQKSLLAQAKSSLEAQRGEIFRLNELLQQNSCKDIEDKLASMLAENNNLKAENDQAKQSLKSKEDEIASLQQRVDSINSQLAKCEEAIKSTDCSKYINEIESLKHAIAIHLDEIKQQTALLESVKREIEAAKANNASLQLEIDNIKTEKEAANQALKVKEAEMNKIRNDFANASQPQDNDQLRKCLEEQKRLEDENKRLQEEFKQLENLVKDIEEEQKKNKQLESLIEELEQRIKDLQSHQTTVVPGPDINVQSIIDKLKDQLQMETNKNNALTTELQTCKSSLVNLQEKLNSCLASLKELEICRDQLQTTQSQLKEKEAAVENLKREIESTKLIATVKPVASVGPSVRPVPSVDRTTEAVASSESIVKAAQVTESVVVGSAQSFVGSHVIAVGSSHGNLDPNSMLASTISEIQNSHCANLEKMQKMYEERMREMMINHDKEIQSLRMTNEALRKTLVDIKAQIAALGGIGDIGKLDQINKELEELKLGVCKCNKESSDINVCGHDTKLNKICTKILKTSIDCLSLRELKYLHCAVYKAGCKMKPMIAADANEMGRCCQCTGFVCSLPSIPKGNEKKFIERINCLENELENANDVLERLRERYESKGNCSRRCCAGQTERRAPPRGINDAVNQILKCAREGRRNSGG